MSLSLILACIWGLVANLMAMLPSRDNHWTFAYILIAIGIPIVGFVTWQHGPGVGIFVLGAGMSVLRWPVIYLSRRIKGWVQGRKDKVEASKARVAARNASLDASTDSVDACKPSVEVRK